MLARLRRGFEIFLAMLHEIFDESAYARFLARNNTARSAASFRAFQQECEHTRARKPRCC
jgi:hypothetical protein